MMAPLKHRWCYHACCHHVITNGAIMHVVTMCCASRDPWRFFLTKQTCKQNIQSVSQEVRKTAEDEIDARTLSPHLNNVSFWLSTNKPWQVTQHKWPLFPCLLNKGISLFSLRGQNGSLKCYPPGSHPPTYLRKGKVWDIRLRETGPPYPTQDPLLAWIGGLSFLGLLVWLISLCLFALLPRQLHSKQRPGFPPASSKLGTRLFC